VSTNKDIVVKDSCILFDLIDLGLLEPFFRLELVIFTTMHVIEEIEDGSQLHEVNKYVTNGKLLVDRDGSLETITKIFQDCPGLSLADSSVLELAGRLGASILTADKTLRNVGTKRTFTVRGVLWIIEELYSKQKITLEEALLKLELYPKVNGRAPKIETSALIEKLSKINGIK
jgi:hypothetical protein